jgi:translation initiation factor 4G
MPSLDDDAIDFPQAYKAIAVLMRSISLDDAEIGSLMGMIDLYGQTPKITPQMKLDRAFAALDEEEANK